MSKEQQTIRERRTPSRPFSASAIDRHQLDAFDEGTRIKRANTMLLPGASLEVDIRAINNGVGFWLGNNRWEIHDRIYVHKGDGTVFPISGVNVVSLTKHDLIALKHLIVSEGDEAALYELTVHDPNINVPGDIVRRRALAFYRLWKASRDRNS